MKSIFIVRNPFQLLNSIEAKHHFENIGISYLLCIYKKEIDRKLMEKMIDPKDWEEVFFFSLTAKNRLLYPFILNDFLSKCRYAEYCFFGLTTPLISHCINEVKAKKNILIDDGNEIFMIVKKIENKSIFDLNTYEKKYNKFMRRNVDYQYAKHMSIFSFFDLSMYTINNNIIRNDYRFFRQNVSVLPQSKEVFFIGSNIVDNYMNKMFFEQHMEKVIQYYKPRKVIYILHRYENEVYIKQLGKRLGFQVVRFPVILELALLEYGKKPEIISTFRSTALETLGYLYAPIMLEVFKVREESLFTVEQKEEYKDLYIHYEKIGIPIIEKQKVKSQIAIIVTNLASSGAEKIALTQAKLFREYGHDVVLFLLDNVKRYDTEDCDFPIETLTKGKNTYKVLGKLGDKIYARILQKKMQEYGKFDLVISNLPRADRVVKLLEHPNKYFVIHTSYKTELEKFAHRRGRKKEKLYQYLYTNENIITVADAIIHDFDHLNIKYKHAMTIYNPFSFEYIRLQGEEKIDLDFDYIISPSAFRKEKRYDVLLDAFAMLKSSVKLVILANSDPKLEAMIKERKLEEKVVILPFQQNPYKYIKHAKLLVLSSEREGLPTVMIESLILGTPVVATNCPTGPSEILCGSLSHWLVPVNNPEALAAKIDEALESTIEIDETLLERFNKKSVYEQFKTLL